MKKIADLQDRQGTVVAEIRSIVDKSSQSAEDLAKIEKLEGEALQIDREIATLKKLEEREALLAKERVSHQQTQLTEKQIEDREHVVFKQILKAGTHKELSNEDREFLNSRAAGPMSGANPTTGADGGILVPRTLYAMVERFQKAFGGVLDVARVMPTEKGEPLGMPKSDNTARKGRIVAENAVINTGEKLQFAKLDLTGFMFTSDFVLIPSSFLQDASIDVMAYVAMEVAEATARAYNEKLTIGAGTTEPKGIVVGAGASGITAAATSLTADNILDLIHSVNSAYRKSPSAGLMFNDLTLGVIRKLKDSNGRYLWDNGNIQQGIAPTIWGHPYTINDDMANIGASAKSMIFGDMSKYIVRKIGSPRLIVDKSRFLDYDQTAVVMFERLDGDTINSAAIKSLVHAAS